MMPMNHSFLRGTLLALGCALLGLWCLAEFALGMSPLPTSEMQHIVGGVEGPAGCQLFSQEKYGYRCGNNRTMSCSLICSPCTKHSNNDVLCRLKQCWGCKDGGTNNQIRECIVGTEEQNCDTFGGNGVCGNEENNFCLFDTTEDRCYCETPLHDSGFPCPRKDCLDF
jgi:hypothetical protein